MNMQYSWRHNIQLDLVWNFMPETKIFIKENNVKQYADLK